jgi:hypothetical protein
MVFGGSLPRCSPTLIYGSILPGKELHKARRPSYVKERTCVFQCYPLRSSWTYRRILLEKVTKEYVSGTANALATAESLDGGEYEK